jgi:hypothetical protein
MALQIKPGSRFRSAACDVEIIVVKAPADAAVDLRAGGHEMLPMGTDRPGDVKPEPGFDEGTQMGKRYTDDSGSLEVLCTKPGPSSLSIGETLLVLKEAKPLPSSD